MQECAVIIPTLNGGMELKKVLTPLTRYLAPQQILILDSGSRDATLSKGMSVALPPYKQQPDWLSNYVEQLGEQHV